MDGRPTWTDCDEAGDYVVPNVLSPRDLVSRPDIMDETVPHTNSVHSFSRYGEKKQILASIKGRNSVANLRKTTIHNPKVDLVNDNVKIQKFCLILSIRSQDIDQKPNFNVNQGP